MKFKLLFALIAAFVPVVGFAQGVPFQSENQQVKDLDKEIKEFKDARAVAQRKAYEAGNRATQFLGLNWFNYRTALKEQKRYEQIVKDLDEKIAELEKQKAALQK